MPDRLDVVNDGISSSSSRPFKGIGICKRLARNVHSLAFDMRCQHPRSLLFLPVPRTEPFRCAASPKKMRDCHRQEVGPWESDGEPLPRGGGSKSLSDAGRDLGAYKRGASRPSPEGWSRAPTLRDRWQAFASQYGWTAHRTGSCAVQERGEREKQEGPVARSNKVWGDCSTSISNRWKTLCRPSPARTLPMPARNERELTAAYKPTELASPSPKPSKQRKRCPCK